MIFPAEAVGRRASLAFQGKPMTGGGDETGVDRFKNVLYLF
jgi:hypothetical protein